LVIKAGGVVSKETMKVFESLKELDKRDMATLYQSIGISLLLSRTRKMSHCWLLSSYGEEEA
jgi:hypothetical protein